MGYAPPRVLKLPSQAEPLLWPDWYIADLRQTVRKGRRSWLPSRRRAAYAAVLQLIRWREADLWPEPPEPPRPMLYHDGMAPPVPSMNYHQVSVTSLGDSASETNLRVLQDSMLAPIYGSAVAVVPVLAGHPGEVTPDGHDWRTGKPVQVYRYAWGNNPRRAELKGRECVIEARGKLGTVLVRFLDTGEQVTTSARAVRRVAVAAVGSPC